MKLKTLVSLSFACLLFAGIAYMALGEGSLKPPDTAFDESGEPKAFMKTLEEVEPRMPIDELPFVITSPGSYYLVGSFQGAPNSNGITIFCGDVQLDLNGFALFGHPSALNGIYVKGATSGPPEDIGSQYNISIRNGCLIEWPEWGVNASNGHNVTLIEVETCDNTLGGITVGENSTFKECEAMQNGGPGFVAGSVPKMKDCMAMGNSGNGFKVGDGARLIGCTTVENLGQGVEASIGATITDCKAVMNQLNGIHTLGGARIHGCTSVENCDNGINLADAYCIARDCLVMMNTNNGIVAFASCHVVENLCGDNGQFTGGAGILVHGPGNRIVRNDITANQVGIRLDGNGASGNWIADNTVVDNMLFGIIATNAPQKNLIVRNAVGSDYGTDIFVVGSGNRFGSYTPYQSGPLVDTNAWGNLILK